MTEKEWNNLLCENCGLAWYHHGRVTSEPVFIDGIGHAYVLTFVWDACPMPVKSRFVYGDGVQLHIDFWIFENGWERLVSRDYD